MLNLSLPPASACLVLSSFDALTMLTACLALAEMSQKLMAIVIASCTCDLVSSHRLTDRLCVELNITSAVGQVVRDKIG